MKKLSFVASVMLVVMFLAGQAMAGMGAPYNSYSGAAYGEDYYGDEESRNERGRSSQHYSPELPVYSDTWIGNPDQYAEANSSMNVGGEGGGPVGAAASGSVNVGGAPVSVDLHAYANNDLAGPTYSEANAEAMYSEYFTAAAPVYQLAYDYSYVLFAQGFAPDAYARNEVTGYLQLYDITLGNYVYSDNFLYTFVEAFGIESDSAIGGGPGMLNLDLIVGNEYNVWMDIYEYAHAGGNATAGNDSVHVDYSVNVVPEPISTILFVTGGTLLACRRFFFPKEDV